MRTAQRIALFSLVALVATGCSNQVIVVGNVTSMLVTFGLFYTTINLRKER